MSLFTVLAAGRGGRLGPFSSGRLLLLGSAISLALAVLADGLPGVGARAQAQGIAYPGPPVTYQPPPQPAPGFFQSLFGGGSSSPHPGPMPGTLPPGAYPLAPRSPLVPLPGSPSTSTRASSSAETGKGGSGLGGGYRTMCVRLCDGYYWPITSNAARSRFQRDAKVCQASCDTEARLFAMPVSGEAKDMVDLQGRAYSKLPTAFRYRKTLDESCRCRAEAWAPSEAARHETYAERRKARAADDGADDGTSEPPAATAMPASVPPLSEAKAEALALAGGLVRRDAVSIPVAEAPSGEPVATVAALAAAAPSPNEAAGAATKPSSAGTPSAKVAKAAPRSPNSTTAGSTPVVAAPRRAPSVPHAAQVTTRLASPARTAPAYRPPLAPYGLGAARVIVPAPRYY